MREIKFRGFNKKRNTWIVGYYLQNRGADFVCPDEFATGKTWEDYEVEPETVGQYTGVKDRNGREIYEGDIITLYENPKYEYVVEWIEGKAMFLCRCLQTKLGLANLPYNGGERVEIIKNKYDYEEK